MSNPTTTLEEHVISYNAFATLPEEQKKDYYDIPHLAGKIHKDFVADLDELPMCRVSWIRPLLGVGPAKPHLLRTESVKEHFDWYRQVVVAYLAANPTDAGVVEMDQRLADDICSHFWALAPAWRRPENVQSALESTTKGA